MKFPASLDPLEVTVKQKEQIRCLNMKSIELKLPVTNLYTMSSGHIDLCTFFGIWDIARALANCQHPCFFGTQILKYLRNFTHVVLLKYSNT